MTIERIPIVDRASWLELRTRDITASDVPAVCGEGVYGSAAQVWAEKRGLVPPKTMTDAMKRGIWGEPAVFEAIGWEYPEWEVRRAKVYLRDADARLGATPDGVAMLPGRSGITVVQCKVVARQVFCEHWLENPDDDPHDPMSPAAPPMGYHLQTLTESMLADAEAGVVAALIVDAWKWSLRIFDVPRHAPAEKMIRERVGEFWRRYLDPGIQPPVDSQRDESLVKALYPRDDGREIDLSGDNELPAIVDDLTRARADKKDAETRERSAKTCIADKMGAASYARMAGGRRISFKTQRRAAYMVSESEYRVLRIMKG